jgi:hypothetical protein
MMLDPAVAGTPAGRTKFADLRRSVGLMRRSQKRITNLLPGKGGLEIAQAPRTVPDAPSKVREAIRDVRPGRWRTSWPEKTAPAQTIEDAGAARAANPVPSAAIPFGTDSRDSSSLPMTDTATGAPVSVSLPLGQGTQAGPSTSDAPAALDSRKALLLVAAIAAVFLFRK